MEGQIRERVHTIPSQSPSLCFGGAGYDPRSQIAGAGSSRETRGAACARRRSATVVPLPRKLVTRVGRRHALCSSLEGPMEDAIALGRLVNIRSMPPSRRRSRSLPHLSIPGILACFSALSASSTALPVLPASASRTESRPGSFAIMQDGPSKFEGLPPLCFLRP